VADEHHAVVDSIGLQLAQRLVRARLAFGVVGCRQVIAARLQQVAHLGDVGRAHVVAVRQHRVPQHRSAQHSDAQVALTHAGPFPEVALGNGVVLACVERGASAAGGLVQLLRFAAIGGAAVLLSRDDLNRSIACRGWPPIIRETAFSTTFCFWGVPLSSATCRSSAVRDRAHATRRGDIGTAPTRRGAQACETVVAIGQAKAILPTWFSGDGLELAAARPCHCSARSGGTRSLDIAHGAPTGNRGPKPR
jgi:hypothetical protein